MKKNYFYLLLLLTGTAMAQSQTRKVLFLGNSYTYENNLPQLISQVAASTGDVLVYDGNLVGGYTLQAHAADAVSLNKITAQNWDYIVLQEQSQRPAFVNPTAFFEGFSSLSGYIKQHRPCTQITAFMTWGHQNGDVQNCPQVPYVCTYEGMQNLLQSRYLSAATLGSAEVTPVGVVWRYIRENYPSINLYQPDGSHPSAAGSYIAACCFYTSLYRKDPTLITDNYVLDVNTAMIIRNAVKTLVYDAMQDWYIGRYVPVSYFYYHIIDGANNVKLNGNSLQNKDWFVWEFGDGATSQELQPVHSYAADGTYTIKLTSGKCYLGQDIISVFERTVNFCQHTNTIYPDLMLCPDQAGTIWTQPADSYQWLDAFGEPIEGATNQWLEVYSGQYSVETTINGCTERSPVKHVDGWIDIGLGECSLGNTNREKPADIEVFPNPAEHSLFIQSSAKVVQVYVYSILGEKVTAQLYNGFIDVSALAKGVYLLKAVTDADEEKTIKFIKQ